MSLQRKSFSRRKIVYVRCCVSLVILWSNSVRTLLYKFYCMAFPQVNMSADVLVCVLQRTVGYINTSMDQSIHSLN